jgi:predicted DNA-binding protein (MmcQ/YjbR family)
VADDGAAPPSRPERGALIEAALRYPEAYLDHPWGEDVVKVRGRIFAFFGVQGEQMYVGVKLPSSADFALMQPFASPAGYNLARAGWVTCRFEPGDEVPSDVLLDWLDESYRAVAPRRLAATVAPRG